MALSETSPHALDWPAGDLTRVPYRLYRDEAVYARERERLFLGRSWNFVGLDVEIPEPGDYRTSFIGDVPVIVVRDEDGAVQVLENRCAHRGALVCLKAAGNAKRLTCVYHAWSYDLQGRLVGLAFRNGVKGQGGMPGNFDAERHGLRRYRVEIFCGLVFATLAADMPTVEDHLGPEIAARIRRVFCKPIEVLGYGNQVLPNNWKLYVENVKDSYHASILHLFFTTFKINRLSQQGGVLVDPSGGHHVSYSKIERGSETGDYAAQGIRSENARFRLQDPALLENRDEFDDGITLQILTVFPNFVVQQIQNTLAVRQILPKGVARTELLWTHFGFADDDAGMRTLRRKQSNFVGPAGYISMEDGAVGDFVQRGIAGAEEDSSVVMMGGSGTGSETTRATETSVRGFWKAYRAAMEL